MKVAARDDKDIESRGKGVMTEMALDVRLDLNSCILTDQRGARDIVLSAKRWPECGSGRRISFG